MARTSQEVFELDGVQVPLSSLAERGDPSWDIDAHAGSLDGLLDLARADEEERGLHDNQEEQA
jgi:hypothetical protein